MNSRKIIFKLFLATIISSFLGCSTNFSNKIEKFDHSLLIHQDSIITQIEILDESIIHVKKYLPEEEKSSIPDYVTVLKPQPVDWKVSEKKDCIIVETSKTKVVINDDGVIEYFSSEGKKILSESQELTYIKPTDNTGYSVSQAFDSGDEGLYGLGQFQSGIMNWKNVPVRLQQFNQEIAIPFVVSTNNYGIYWHNYSITDFNYPENEILFSKTIDEKKNIRESVFIPSKSGVYSFMVESENPEENRALSPILVSIDSDTVIHYSTYWVPDCHMGQKYLEAGKEYIIVFQNSNSQVPGRLLYNEPDFNKTVFSSRKGNAIDYYFIHGNHPAEVISEYGHLTGRAPMFPKSAFGFWQCRERYHNQKELLENAREYRKRSIPIDNIVQDWFYWPEGEKGPEWDRNKYPNPKAMIDELDSLNLQLMVSVWPEVKNKALVEKYDLADYKLKESDNLDFYDAGVRERYYRMLSDSMFHFGVTSIWLDGTEPETKPEDKTHTASGKFEELTNSYSLLVNKAMYEGKRKEYPDERVFNLTRSAYAGQQRYGAASWSGDVAATWEQFAEQIPAGLNFMMAGIPYWTTDIGGFFRDSRSLNPIYKDQYTDDEFIELLTRWFQFGSFNPIFRIHGYVSETEIWRYGHEFEDMARNFIDIRYQLMPYTYSEAWKVSSEGKLLMSPLVYQYPDDKNTWGIKDQFLFGESILVCPVTKYKARSRELYLPEGYWYNYWSGEKLKGGKRIVARAPLNEMPLYVKAGSILPLGPKVQYATQETNEPLRIKVYPGKDAEYVVYMDDNESFDYHEGIYSEIIFTYSDSKKEIIIRNGTDKFMDFTQNPKDIIIEIIGSGKTEHVVFSGKKVQLKTIEK